MCGGGLREKLADMKKLIATLVCAMLATTAVGITGGPVSAQVSEQPTLWITDDVTRLTYHVTLDGTVLGQFSTPNSARSSIAIDPADRSLWGANEGSASGFPPGKLVNYDRQGQVIQEVLAGSFNGLNTEGVAITVAIGDDSLWVVDDPTSNQIDSYVYNVNRDGSLIASFPVSTFDPNVSSPQAIAFDPYTTTLWITDNLTERVYNVSLTGSLISSFPVDVPLFGSIRNIQGVSVESADVLWLTGRDTGRIYQVTKAGDQVLSSFTLDGVENPTGVAYDRPPGDLGAAASFSLLGLPGSVVKIKGAPEFTGVVGDVGLAKGAMQDFDDGLLTGVLRVDPGANNSHRNTVVISDGTQSENLSLATADSRYASLAASALRPTQVFGQIMSNVTITGGPGLNVITAARIELDGAESLTLVGSASSTFIINVADRFKLKDRSAIVLDGGLAGNNVFFNIVGTADSSIESGSLAVGTIIAQNAKLKIKGEGSTLLGAMIGGSEIKLENGGRLRGHDEALAPGSIGSAAGAGVLGLPGAKVKLADAGSTVVGSVILGPFAKQEFSEGHIEGTLLVDPLASNSRVNAVTITGGTITTSASRAVADAVDASNAAARMKADVVFKDIKSDLTISGGPGLTVVYADKIELDGGNLTLTGEASSRFVINLADEFKLENGSSVLLEGGVLAQNVLFNFVGGGDFSIEKGGAGQGTILAPYSKKVKVKDSGSSHFGPLIGGGDITIEKAGVVSAIG